MDENMNNNTSVEETVEQNDDSVKTYTAEEVAKLVQAESDRRTNQALAKQKREYERKLSLSNLDENERAKAEKDAEIADLKEKLAQYEIEKNKSELKSILGERGLDVRLADLVKITDDLEESQQNIETLDKIFKECVRKEVEKRLAGNAPKGNGGGASGEITKEQFKQMSLSEQSALYKNNPELYKKLILN